MNQIAQYIIFLMLFLLVYPFLIYPLILVFLSLVKGKKINKSDSFTTSVTVLIAAYNEEKFIADCITSVLNSDYPADKLNIVVGSDGSSDKTNKIVEEMALEHTNITFLKLPRSGKNIVINKMLEASKTELIYVLDADLRFQKDTLRKVVTSFNDPDVGGVIPGYKLQTKNENVGSIGERFYQRFENGLRKLESSINSTPSSLGGGCYRRDCLELIPNDKVCDDLFYILETAKKKRVIYLDKVFIDEARGRSLAKEFSRRIRIVSCGMSSIFGMPDILKPSAGIFSFFIWSHKVVRWFSLFYLVLMFLTTFLLSPGDFKEWMLLTNYLIIVSIFSAYVFEKTDVKFPILKLPLFYFIMVSSFAAGFFRYLSNKQNAIWTQDGLEDQKQS